MVRYSREKTVVVSERVECTAIYADVSILVPILSTETFGLFSCLFVHIRSDLHRSGVSISRSVLYNQIPLAWQAIDGCLPVTSSK